MSQLTFSTRVIPATDTLGTQIKVTTPYDESLTVQWDYALDTLANHRRAVAFLAHTESLVMVGTTARGYKYRTEN